MKINLDIVERNPNTGEAIKTGEKLIYSASDFVEGPCSKWVRETKYKNEPIDGLLQKSGFNFTEKSSSKNSKDVVCYFHSAGNNIQHNSTLVGLYSMAFSSPGWLPLYPDNFLRGIVLFASRKSIKGNWINDKDEYIAPTSEVMESDEYKQFEADALVYSLFHGGNNCTSCRDIPYKDTTVDISNPMFWRPPDIMQKLADAVGYHEMYGDCRLAEESYVSKIINNDDALYYASRKAIDVFEMADRLLIGSMKMREEFSMNYPEYHLDSFDAGYYQLKYLYRECYKQQHDEFIIAFKRLEASIIPRVYELGFLR